MKQFLDRYAAIIVLLAAFAFLVFGYLRVASAVRIPGPALAGEVVTLQRPDLGIRFERDGGAGRPYITDGTGNPILEYTDWASSLHLDGSVSDLWAHFHGYAVDKEKGQLAHTIKGDQWQIQKLVALEGVGQAKVEFYFSTSARFEEVRLTVAHYHWYWSRVEPKDDGFAAYTENSAGGQPAQTRLDVLNPSALAKDGPVKVLLQDEHGIANVGTVYVLRNPEVNRLILLAAERVTYKP